MWGSVPVPGHLELRNGAVGLPRMRRACDVQTMCATIVGTILNYMCVQSGRIRRPKYAVFGAKVVVDGHELKFNA